MAAELQRLHIWFTEEEEGGYSVHIDELPGCVSCGDTKEEAMLMILDALSGVLETYRDTGITVPWKEVEEPETFGAGSARKEENDGKEE